MTRRQIVAFLDSRIGVSVRQGLEFNQMGAKPRQEAMAEGGVELFNEVYSFLLKSGLKKTVRTKSGAIAKGMANWGNAASWDVAVTAIGVRLTAIIGGNTYVLKLGAFKAESDPGVYPGQAFMKFRQACEEKGIDLDSYAEDNGAEVKKDMPRPMIAMARKMKPTDKGLSNVNHIDFHSSYPAGLCNKHPEFRKVVEPIYEKRKDDPSCKAVLNFSIGCMQSLKEPFKARWARLAKDAIEDNNERMKEMALRLTISGRTLLGFNTDGIWYQGDPYHGDGEGDGLGQWRNDHINCVFRSKSDGAYEFIEDGRYYAVVRGLTTYDKINPDRPSWQWGDIYKGEIVRFYFEEGKGVKIYA